jgi:nicotinate-nucleotide adenylyltransferase
MKVGLFFGSFNPIHVGHLVLANYMLSFTNLNEVWFVVSPQNPLKEKGSLLNDRQRLAMVKLAVADKKGYKVSDIEFGLSKPSFTINTLTHLKEKYPKKVFALIMGADNLATFHKWKNYEEILKRHELFVYPRLNSNTDNYKNISTIHFTNAPQMEISSTFIRQAIADNIDVSLFLSPAVHEYIEEMNFYKKQKKTVK